MRISIRQRFAVLTEIKSMFWIFFQLLTQQIGLFGTDTGGGISGTPVP